MRTKFDLDNQVALVTGGAQGIGAAVVQGLCELGATVLLTDRDVAQGEAYAAKLVAQGFRASFLPLDVTQEGQWQQVMDTLSRDYQRLDILVNNAGILFHRPADETSLADLRRMNAVNVDGVFLGCQYAARLMKATAAPDKRAAIINLSSVGGIQGMKNLSAYCCSKGAVRTLTKSLAAELGPDHIRVNSVHPGVVDTSMGTQVTEMIAQGLGTDMATATEALHALNPLQANAKPEDVAGAVAFLASPAANFITGAEIVIDGGTSACR